MDISELTVRLIVLLIPGALATLVVDKLTEHRPWSAFTFSVHSVLLGSLSYFAYQGLAVLWGFVRSWLPSYEYQYTKLSFWSSLFDTSIPVSLKEVALTCVVAVLVAYLVSAVVYHNLPFKVARKLGVSSKFGDEDLWAHFLNSKDVDWVWVRDHARNLVYEGWVQAFSVTTPVREIMLRQVKVYSNEDGEHLYDVPAMYVAGSPDEISLEIPIAKGEQGNGGEEASEAA